MKTKIAVALTAALLMSSCAQTPYQPQVTAAQFAAAYQTINEHDFRQHVKTIASDEFGGRLPATPGEKLTLDYLTQQFAALGFKPGNGDSYLQAVPMVAITADPNMTLTLGKRQLAYKTDMVMGTSRVSHQQAINDSPLVFVGYGINAPEYGWNDYQGLDVKGKTVVILVNDPGFETGDASKFTGKAMTYYGRWTYKFEEASRQGAAGAIIVHETAPASYGWSVVQNSWSGPQYGLKNANNNMDRVAVEGWITEQAARDLFADAGLNFDTEKAKAVANNYHQTLPLSASVTVNASYKESQSYNFIATLPGTDARQEHIVYSAHWDHLGTDPNKEGDNIYNGAHDNATGTAGLIEVAQAFSHLPSLHRSVTFVAVTAEEQGLLGSKYYAAHPVIPMQNTVANINMDSLSLLGRAKDINVVGFGKSTMDDHLQKAAVKQSRMVAGDPAPERGGFYRSDHFSFAKMGVPALYAGGGNEPVDDATARYKKRMKVILTGCYHQACDNYRDSWDVSGAIEDMQLLFDVGVQLADSDIWPSWKAGAEFKRQ